MFHTNLHLPRSLVHLVIFVPSTTAKRILFLNHMNKKVIGGKHNVLINSMDASAPNPSGLVLCNPFKWDILWFILIKNLVICVPTTLAKQILFLNHMNKKVVGGKHNILVHYVDVCAPNLFVVVLCNTFKWDILWFILIKNLVIFVPTTIEKQILFLNHRNKKVVEGKHNFLVHYVDVCAPNLFSVVLCNPFIWDILWFIFVKNLVNLCAYHNSKTSSIPTPHGQKS